MFPDLILSKSKVSILPTGAGGSVPKRCMRSTVVYFSSAWNLLQGSNATSISLRSDLNGFNFPADGCSTARKSTTSRARKRSIDHSRVRVVSTDPGCVHGRGHAGICVTVMRLGIYGRKVSVNIRLGYDRREPGKHHNKNRCAREKHIRSDRSVPRDRRSGSGRGNITN